MKKISIVLVALFAFMQYKLWFAPGNLLVVSQMKQQVEGQRQINEKLKYNNNTLASSIGDLKGNIQAIEARARIELGMIKKGEKFYQVVE